ncbi:hypothetical protein HZS80_23020, partial [Halomonas glaciei]
TGAELDVGHGTVWVNGDIRYIAMQFSRLEAFLGAGLTDSGAMPDAYVDSHTQTELVYAGIATYAKLTGAAIGISVAKKIHKNINPT